MLADGRNEFREQFEGYEVPDPKVAIPLYLSHTTTRNLYNKMVEWAMHKYICTAKEMAKLSHDYVERLHLKNGHRIQVFKLFKRRHYMEAINKPTRESQVVRGKRTYSRMMLVTNSLSWRTHMQWTCQARLRMRGRSGS